MKNGASSIKADRIILALLEHGTIEKAAASLGLSDVTVWRWLKKPDFQEAYQKARGDAFSRAIARLQHASGSAVSVLLRVMVDKDAPAASRVRAADSVLDRAANAFELDLEVRMQRLELQAQTAAQDSRQPNAFPREDSARGDARHPVR